MDEHADEHVTPTPGDLPHAIPLGESIPEVLPAVRRRPRAAPGFWIALGCGSVVYVLMLAVGGEAAAIALAGIEMLPFLLLAVLAYAGLRHDWARALTIVYWGLLMAGFALFVWLMSIAALVQPAGPQGAPDPSRLRLAPDAPPRLALAFLGVVMGVVLGGLCFVPALRRAWARTLPLEAGSFVQGTALATVVALTLISLVPLLALGEPLLLLLLHNPEFREGMTRQDGLRLQLYGLLWLVPVAFVAVGYPLQRTLREARWRLGLVWPTLTQVILALVGAALLVLAVWGVDAAIAWLWEGLGWPTTRAEEVERLFRFAIHPLGAVVIGVVAGLGEELAVRGVLQPRMGIVLSNLLFTAVHAFQYNFDALLSIFLVGLVLGLVRKYVNTTTSAVVHGAYDFFAIMLMYLEWPPAG
jgi:membrane protease YdiL (CAAX protease family)